MRAKLLLMTVLSTLAAVAVLNVVPSAAVDPPPPIFAEPLSPRSVFPDEVEMKIKLKSEEDDKTKVKVDDASRTVVVRYTVQPGARFPWHTHYGPVFVNVASGSLTYVTCDDHRGHHKAQPASCSETTYTMGQAFVDAGHGHIHSAYNPGTEVTNE